MRLLRSLPPLTWFLGSSALLWLVTVLVPLVHHGAWYPGYPFFIQEHAFSDLTIFIPQFLHFRQQNFYTASEFPLTYPALSDILIAVLLSNGHGVLTFCVAVAVAVLAAVWITANALARHGLSRAAACGLVGWFVLTSFPLYFDLSRANIEFFNCLCLAAGISLCWRKHWNAGAVFLGLAVACKLYPVILLGFLVGQRKYRATVTALVSAALATLGSLAVLGPSITQAQRQISAGLTYFDRRWVIVLSRGASTFDHSLFGGYKLICYHLVHQADFQRASRVYLFVAVLLAVALYFGRIIHLPATNQIVILTTLAVLIPPVSYDYTLLALYIPLIVLVLQALRSTAGDKHTQALVISFQSLAWALSPETYLRSITGLTKCIALLVLVAVQCLHPLSDGDHDRQSTLLQA